MSVKFVFKYPSPEVTQDAITNFVTGLLSLGLVVRYGDDPQHPPLIDPPTPGGRYSIGQLVGQRATNVLVDAFEHGWITALLSDAEAALITLRVYPEFEVIYRDDEDVVWPDVEVINFAAGAVPSGTRFQPMTDI